MNKNSSVIFNGISENADCNEVALYGRLLKGKTYKVLAGYGDANIARCDGCLGAVILSKTAIVLKDESGYFTLFSLNSGLFTVKQEAQPSEQVTTWSDRREKLSPIFKPCRVRSISPAIIGEFTAADASPSY